ncbi:16S rRNA (guanine(527)-N(7))-methyltransferase RsmG [Rhizosaccharibacter radicis]|uniref:Ribosomal RNA small subunit methyltransferase G n=1 Tax=Rhizosaccharibacter radicis TaxID=2782605 RepID=A0ABT1VSU1_9PROT|nr:16S rRNA (guanine(527)-N(7))-methyltransferase RsmG [Acetobacteraceae bacterium KSS12]
MTPPFPDQPPAVREKLVAFAALLRRWNARINLVSPADLPVLEQRHVADCLQLVPLLPPDAATLTDMGSGAGFPGLILAIATGLPATLIESDQRKASFLREAARTCGASVSVLPQRLEEARPPPAPVVTARALAPLGRLLGWAEPLLAPGGICLFLKGRQAGDELTAAAAEWHMAATRIPSRTSADGVILRLSDIRRATSDAGPRRS